MLTGILVSLALLAPSARVAEQPAVPDRATLLAAARAVMGAAGLCTLVTLGPDGQPQARVVDPFDPEDDFSIWIGTNRATRKVAEIRADPRVTLLYLDPADPGYVTVIGTAELVDDPDEKAHRFKDAWARFYKDRHRGPDYLLIRVRPARLEISSEAHGIVNDPVTWRPVTLSLD